MRTPCTIAKYNRPIYFKHYIYYNLDVSHIYLCKLKNCKIINTKFKNIYKINKYNNNRIYGFDWLAPRLSLPNCFVSYVVQFHTTVWKNSKYNKQKSNGGCIEKIVCWVLWLYAVENNQLCVFLVLVNSLLTNHKLLNLFAYSNLLTLNVWFSHKSALFKPAISNEWLSKAYITWKIIRLQSVNHKIWV